MPAGGLAAAAALAAHAHSLRAAARLPLLPAPLGPARLRSARPRRHEHGDTELRRGRPCLGAPPPAAAAPAAAAAAARAGSCPLAAAAAAPRPAGPRRAPAGPPRRAAPARAHPGVRTGEPAPRLARRGTDTARPPSSIVTPRSASCPGGRARAGLGAGCAALHPRIPAGSGGSQGQRRGLGPGIPGKGQRFPAGSGAVSRGCSP